MADTVERLLLQVDASIELLRRNLAGAEAPLTRFERRAAATQANVERSIGSMGGRFGDFARLADDAAARAEASFTASFNQVQRIAGQAIKGPTIDGRVNLGVDDIRAGAAAAQEQARSFALIEEAARAAAARVGDTSDATRLFLQATSASRIEAERKATALLAEAGALERVEIELMQSADATELFVTRHQRIAQAADQQRQLALSTAASATEQRALAAAADIVRAGLDPMFLAQKRFNDEMDRADELLRTGTLRQHEYEAETSRARATLFAHAQAVAGGVAPANQLITSQNALRSAMQGVSYQAQDVFTQMSMGANILQVVAIQGAQAAGGFAYVEAGSSKALGRVKMLTDFMMGPWGLAFTFALLVLAPLTKGLLDFGDAEDDAVAKQREDALAADAAAKAKDRFSRSVDGVTAALKESNKALDDSAAAERSSAERANIAARAKRDLALATRQATAAKLADALADLDGFQLTGGTTGAAALQNQADSDRVRSLRAQLDQAQANVTEAERQLNRTRVDLAAENAAIAVDPVRSVTKLYDDRIKALKDAQREEAKLGRQVGAESQRRLEQLEREKKKAIETAQARQSAERRSNRPENIRQTGREITVDDARAIVAGIGGRVTSGVRSREKQEQLYARYQAGTGPLAAKPGTSLHEQGGAVDIAKSGGISLAKIRKAFADQGVRLTELLDEGTHFHAGFGKKGPSASNVQRQAEAARQKVLSDDIRFVDEERAARRRLIDAKGRSADSEEQRDQLAREDINAEIDGLNAKVRLRQDKGQLDQAEAEKLLALNESTRAQRLQNVTVERATRKLEDRFAAEEQDAQRRLAMLRLSQGMAVTDADRRQIGREILELEQQLRRQALERVRATSQDPAEVQRAGEALKQLPALEERERANDERQNAGPLDQYRARLQRTADDMKGFFDEVKANSLQSVEDSLVGLVTGTESAGAAFKKMANSIISDLIRIAAQRAILSILGGSFLGRASGGPIPGRADGGPIPGFAGGGSPGGILRGPGTGRSDSILAMLSNGRGAIRVSNGEYIINEQATREYLPLIEAINQRRLPKFATGGAIGRTPALPSLRSPSLPAPGRSAAGAAGRMQVEGMIAVRGTELLEAKMEGISIRTMGVAAEPIMAGAQARTMRGLQREMLPGSMG